MILAILAHVALAIFIVVILWPTLKGGSEGYNTKTTGVIVTQPTEVVTEPIAEYGEDVLVDVPGISEAEIVPELESVVESDKELPANTTEMMDEEVVTEPVSAVESEVTEPEVVEQVVVPAEPVSTAEATIHEVTAQVTAFNPLVVFIQPGDMVSWSNMNGHDTQSLAGLIPEGAELWHSKLGENYQRTFTIEGVYIYKCTPHFGTGMGGVIIVGNPTNMEAIVATNQKGAAKRLVKKGLKAIEAHTF